MSDREKIAELLDGLGVDYGFEGNDVMVDPFYISGSSEMVIKFSDDGEFQEFSVYPEDVRCPFCGRTYVT